jgi:O-antigen/teichoic acid export membrane protein
LIIAFFLLCFFQCSIALNNQLLIGFGKISNQNIIQIIQPFFTLIVTIIFIFLGFKSANYYLIAFLISSLITFSVQQFFIKFSDRNHQISTITFTEIAKKGSYTTGSNIAHLVTNRVSYFYINSLMGAAALGVYSTAISLSEAILMAASSAGVVHYSNIAKSKDDNFNVAQTFTFSKYSVLITTLIFCVVYFIPNEFFIQIFGKDFSNVKHLILLFFPGIIALSITHIVTHYFSGLGNFKIPFFASLSSCIVVGTFAKFSLENFQQNGILILTSIGLIIQATILIVAFVLFRNTILQKKL